MKSWCPSDKEIKEARKKVFQEDKLKTLKDIGGTTHVMKSWVKAETIKWVKDHTALSKDNVRFEIKPFGFREVMKMNNITEEDLK